MKQITGFLAVLVLLLSSCSTAPEDNYATSAKDMDFTWNNASIYFLLTDRFNNADPGNDVNFNRTLETAVNRGFMGGDLAGITAKIKEGYFDSLGISAIWMSPFFEQVHGVVDEGTGATYGYHGYWAKDWTTLDPNFGSEEELATLVKTAHEHGIRIVMDVVINHTGPVTEQDPVWPEEWVRTGPRCTYQGYESTVTCTLVENLPDIKTESREEVELPKALLDKWEAEGRLEKELAELDAFFKETGYAKTPTNYIIKWLVDYVKEYGINAYRLDTAKHTEADVWSALRKAVDQAFAEWKAMHPGSFFDKENFYMVGEVYNYGISGGRNFFYGDSTVDFFAEGIDHLINMEFKYDAAGEYEHIFSKYSSQLHGPLEGKGVVNYISSHDDGAPYDPQRENPFSAANKLLLCPGAAQIYYGDESSRVLSAEGAVGDANLRSFMNWEEIMENQSVGGYPVQEVLDHYRKLGNFRKNHPAVGAGLHQILNENPYFFKRSYSSKNKEDVVIIGLDLEQRTHTITVENIFSDGTVLLDSYSGKSYTVTDGKVMVDMEAPTLLLGIY